MSMNNIFKNLLLIVFLITSSTLWTSEYNSDVRKKVLLLNSYHKGYLWSDDITRGVTETFLRENIELHIEYMDSKRQWDSDYQDLLSELLRLKYNRHNYDIIITSDDNAFNFATKNRDMLFSGKPIIFCGVNYLKPDRLYDISNITGVNEQGDIGANIDLIRKIHPWIKNIKIITDNTTTGQKIQENVKKLLISNADIDLDLIFDISGDDLVKLVKESNVNTIFIFTFFFTDKNGQYYDNIISDISKVSKSPIYGAWDFNLNQGITGGVLTSGYFQGSKAAELTLQVLGGTDPDSIPVIYKTPTNIVFDYNQLVRFNIEPDEIVMDSIINRPESFYYKNKELIWTISGILLLLIISLFGVTTGLIRSKKAEYALQQYKDQLEDVVNERTMELQSSLNSLKKAQNQLVESKKMAYLGSLVAGVAHEINTPLGIGITSISHQLIETNNMDIRISGNILKRSELNNYILTAKQSLNLSLSSLQRASDIVTTFKQVAVDQTIEDKQNINLYYFYTDLIKSFNSENDVKINFTCPENLWMETYPGAMILIISNLFNNSLQHGFKGGNYGEINIGITELRTQIEIKYSDTGYGISKKNISHIFDPFYTTNRSSGNIGLGLYIIYNIVVNKLKGSIICESIEDKDTTFTISL